MSLFSAIKYPISLPPTSDQLMALPEDLYNNWITSHTVDWKNHPVLTRRRGQVAEWMSYMFNPLTWSANEKLRMKTTRKEIEKDIKALRKLIKEYDD